MAVREILKMGDPRLLRVAQPVTQFDSDALHLLITDLLDTMHVANGAGLAAPQIATRLTARCKVFMPAWCSTNVTIWWASFTRCACATSASLVSPRCCFRI